MSDQSPSRTRDRFWVYRASSHFTSLCGEENCTQLVTTDKVMMAAGVGWYEAEQKKWSRGDHVNSEVRLSVPELQSWESRPL